MTPPVILTRPWPEDADDMAAALSDWEVVRWLSTVPWPYGAQDARDFVALAGLDEHAVRIGGRLVGMVQAGRVFGIWIAPWLQGQGVGRRASILALSRLFAGPAMQVEAQCMLGNERSLALLTGLGFTPVERVFLQSRALAGPVEAHRLRLSRDDFAARHGLSVRTRHLSVGPAAPADRAGLVRLLGDPRVARMMPGQSREAFLTAAGDGLALPLRLAVRRHDSVVGAIALDDGTPPRLRFLLDPDLSGQGLGQEMVASAFAEMVQRLDLKGAEAETFLDDRPARHILKNLGFRRAEDRMASSPGREGPAASALYRWRRGLLA